MTASQILAHAKARNHALHAYRKYADDLWRLAQWCHKHGWHEAAGWAEAAALIAENAAWAEDRNPNA